MYIYSVRQKKGTDILLCACLLILVPEICSRADRQTDKQTDRQTDMVITILRSPIAGGVTTVASEHDSNNIPIERASQSTTTFPPPLCREPFCAELHTRAVNVTLLAFARAERRAAPCSNRSISPARRAHSSKPAAAAECGGSMMGQTRVVHGSILCDPIQPNPSAD